MLMFRPQIQMQPIDSDAIRRALDTWMQTTENDSRQLLTVVIENISSVRTIHNINKAVFELGNLHTEIRSIHFKENFFTTHQFLNIFQIVPLTGSKYYKASI